MNQLTCFNLLAALVGYLIGSFVTGYYWSRYRHGVDIRTHCSGAAGARNAARLGGTGSFAVVFAADVAKGALAVWIASLPAFPGSAAPVAAVAVVAGHIWPIQLGLKGGKGISPSLGAFLALDPLVSLVAALPIIPIFLVTRSATLGAMGVYALCPAVAWYMGASAPDTLAMATGCTLVVYSHRSNIATRVERFLAAGHDRPTRRAPDAFANEED